MTRTLASGPVRTWMFPDPVLTSISPGPLKTRAASGIAGFDELLDKAAAEAPAGSLVSIEDVGFATAGLATDNAHLITGGTIYVDGGLHIIG